MKIYDNERELVQKRMEEIKENKRTATGNRKITIAAGEPVLKDDADEYKALNRMAEILDNNMKQNSNWEYLDLRNQTKLETLSPELHNSFKNLESETVITSEETTNEQEVLKNEEASYERENSLEPISSTTMSPYGQSTLIPNNQLNIQSQSPKEEDNLGQEVLTGEIIGEGRSHRNTFDDRKQNAIDVEFEEITDLPQKLDNSNDENLVEVVKTTPWKWIKDHKKQILIALGLTALTITLIIAITQLLPAIVASTEAAIAAADAAKVAGISSEMVRNGTMWFSATAGDKLALHGANTALANLITTLTGSANSFNAVSGVWTIGSQTLPHFAASAATAANTAAIAAADAAAKVSLLGNVTLATGLGGLGTLGAGLLTPKKKSAEYVEIKKTIDNLKVAASTMSQEDQTKTAQMISNRIIASTTLSDSERNLLFKKLQKALKKIKKKNHPNEIKSIQENQLPELADQEQLQLPETEQESVVMVNPILFEETSLAKRM